MEIFMRGIDIDIEIDRFLRYLESSSEISEQIWSDVYSELWPHFSRVPSLRKRFKESFLTDIPSPALRADTLRYILPHMPFNEINDAFIPVGYIQRICRNMRSPGIQELIQRIKLRDAEMRSRHSDAQALQRLDQPQKRAISQQQRGRELARMFGWQKPASQKKKISHVLRQQIPRETIRDFLFPHPRQEQRQALLRWLNDRGDGGAQGWTWQRWQRLSSSQKTDLYARFIGLKK
ncbi:hypothetical protein EBZ80_25510 [bacterium]|nr:hypothetical protein [bacterium]